MTVVDSALWTEPAAHKRHSSYTHLDLLFPQLLHIDRLIDISRFQLFQIGKEYHIYCHNILEE